MENCCEKNRRERVQKSDAKKFVSQLFASSEIYLTVRQKWDNPKYYLDEHGHSLLLGILPQPPGHVEQASLQNEQQGHPLTS